LRLLTAGESHGKGLIGIIEGFPSNVPINIDEINADMARRQQGHGRGGRMKIEKDKVEIMSGVRGGKTLGSPITYLIVNKDFENWRPYMDPIEPIDDGRRVTMPRPGHADLTGALKYRFDDVRNVLERSSARETAARVAGGSIVKQLLKPFGIEIHGHVVRIGSVSSPLSSASEAPDWARVEASPVRCAVPEAEVEMMNAIDAAKASGDSLGGIFEIRVTGLPIGLGSYVQWDRKLDAKLAYALMSIQAIKGVEFGLGFEVAEQPGSQVHDEIVYSEEEGYHRLSNRAGGIEGGMSNGEPIVVRCAMKPIPTLYKPLKSVDMDTKEPRKASVERSDACAVPAAAVVGEMVVAAVIGEALIEKLGGDSLEEMLERWKK